MSFPFNVLQFYLKTPENKKTEESKTGRFSSKTVPLGVNYRFVFGRIDFFSVKLLVLSGLSKFCKSFRSDRIDSGKDAVQTIKIIPENYLDHAKIRLSGLWRGTEQTFHTVGTKLIRLCRLWMGLWSDIPGRRLGSLEGS